jgi:hypothetical protein
MQTFYCSIASPMAHFLHAVADELFQYGWRRLEVIWNELGSLHVCHLTAERNQVSEQIFKYIYRFQLVKLRWADRVSISHSIFFVLLQIVVSYRVASVVSVTHASTFTSSPKTCIWEVFSWFCRRMHVILGVFINEVRRNQICIRIQRKTVAATLYGQADGL